MKNILFITSRSDIGGGPKHLNDLTNELKKSYQYFFTIASPSVEPFASKFKESSNNFIEIPFRSFNIISFFKLLFHCKKKDIEIIHSHGRGAGIYSRLLSLFGLKVIHTFHGAHNEENVIGRIKLLLDIFLKHLTNHFICVSRDEYNKALSLGICTKQSTTIVKNGVDISELNRLFNSLNKSEAKEKFLIDSSKITLGTLARLTYQKGVDKLLDYIIKNDGFDLYNFIIAGDGEDHEKITKIIKEKNISNVRILGSINNPAEFLRSIDIYFSTARWEGLPLGVLEAMSCAVPTIINNVEGHIDLKEGAIIYQDNDHEDLLREIKKISHTDGQKAKSFIEEKHSLEKMTKETEVLYRHL